MGVPHKLGNDDLPIEREADGAEGEAEDVREKLDKCNEDMGLAWEELKAMFVQTEEAEFPEMQAALMANRMIRKLEELQMLRTNLRELLQQRLQYRNN